MTFWKKQNYGDKINGCQEFRSRLRWNRQSGEEFQGSETIMYNMKIVNICHYTFVKTYGIYNIKNKPKCKPQASIDNNMPMLVN